MTIGAAADIAELALHAAAVLAELDHAAEIFVGVKIVALIQGSLMLSICIRSGRSAGLWSSSSVPSRMWIL